MAFSYSFHLSSKSHAVNTIGKVTQVSRHNLREYESKDYDKSQIEILRGSDSSILDDVKQIYHDEFDEALERYNEGKRPDRKIDDYLGHVSDSRSDVACELIIQVGDKDFWEDKTMDEKKQMSYIFKDQLRSLEKLVPEMKIASAVVHYDESSPHMHVVGVPVADGYKKGLSKQVAKTKVFTSERLSILQDEMRKRAERGMELDINKNIFGGVELKPKEKGRNKDIPKQSLDEYYALLDYFNDQIDMAKEEYGNTSEKLLEARIELNRKLEGLSYDFSPEEVKQMLSDSLVKNLVREASMQTCLQLEQKGLLKSSCSMAFMEVDRDKIIRPMKEQVENFIDKVRFHMKEMAAKVIHRTHHRSR